MLKSNLHFPDLMFGRAQTQYFDIRNDGGVLVSFSFVPKLNETRICKSWLYVEPASGIIPPGGQTKIQVVASVGRGSGHLLNQDQDRAEDILIFRVENGRDYFLTVTANYNKSCFGASVEWLNQAVAPVRFAGAVAPTTAAATTLRLPKEIWRLIDFIYTQGGMETKGIFSENGKPPVVAAVVESLDTGKPFPANTDVLSVAEALVQLLQNLADPVLAAATCDKYTEEMNMTGFCRQLLSAMPPHNYAVFVYVVSFFREVLKHTPQNCLGVSQLVLVCGRSLMQSKELQAAHSRKNLQRLPKTWVIMQHFLTSKDVF
mmetsp:Transcript_23673/g.46622  ORF Transcript_23673/g.46622 Transcript_23673/m.46622 type:complete len:317 (-) Transcript_23673:50-1000(-)